MDEPQTKGIFNMFKKLFWAKGESEKNHNKSNIYSLISFLFAAIGFILYVVWMIKYHKIETGELGKIVVYTVGERAIKDTYTAFNILSFVLACLSYYYHIRHEKTTLAYNTTIAVVNKKIIKTTVPKTPKPSTSVVDTKTPKKTIAGLIIPVEPKSKFSKTPRPYRRRKNY